MNTLISSTTILLSLISFMGGIALLILLVMAFGKFKYSKIRGILEKEFLEKTDGAMKMIEDQRKTFEIEWKKDFDSLQEKTKRNVDLLEQIKTQKEAIVIEAMREGKRNLLDQMKQRIASDYTSNDTKARLFAFIRKFPVK